MRDEIYLQTRGTAVESPVVVLPVPDPVPIVRTRAATSSVLLEGDGEGVVDAAAAGLLGGRSVVLTTPALRALWEEELAGMRERIRAMRQALVTKLRAAGVQGDLDYITRQKGMFSYSGLSAAQMQRLRTEFGVYGVDSGRICVAAINSRNIDRVVDAIARVM